MEVEETVSREIRGTAEAQLRYYVSLLDAAAEMIVVTDEQGTITWTNSTVHRVMGYSQAEMLERSVLDYVHADEARDVANSMASTIARSGPAEPLEIRMRTKDQRWRFCEVVGSNRIDDPDVRGVIWSARDVTQRLEGQRRFRRLFEANPSPTVLVISEASGVIANPAFASLLGYTREELLHLDRVQIVPLGMADLAEQRAREMFGGVETAFRFDAELQRKDGTIFIADLSMSVTRDDDETAILVTVNDVTEWREAVQALGESQARLEAILDHSADIIAVVQRDGYWTANLTATRLLGYPKGFDPPEGILRMVHSDDRAIAWETLISVMAGHRHPDDPFEVRLVDSDGNVLWHECKARPIYGTGAVVVTARDLTRERANTQRLLDQERLLANEVAARERAELETRVEQALRLESVGRLSAGLAHDFNNLVAVILNYVNVMARNASLDDVARGDLAAIAAAGEQAATLANSLLQFGDNSAHPDSASDLNVVVRALEPLLVGSMRAAQRCTVECHSPAVPVPLERSQCEQVVLNLVLNARDAVRQDGTVNVVVRLLDIDEDRYAVLEVVDNGSGMTDDVTKRAFDPFFTTKPTGVGSGLGLAIVHGIVETSGGQVWFESELGVGTRVQIRWLLDGIDDELSR